MPLTRLQFDVGDLEAVERIARVHSFLKDHREWAYTKQELAIELTDREMTDEMLTEVLDLLFHIGAIDERSVKGQIYYAHEADVEGLA